MESVQQILNDIWAYFQDGFYKVNAIQGLLIAIVAAYLLHKWSRVFVIALGAVLVYVIIDVMVPVIQGAQFKLPPVVEVEYWKYLLTLYAGFIVIITVFYIIKRLLLRGSH